MGQFNETRLDNGVCVVEASGELDLAVADELLETARRQLDGATALHLNLRDVSFIDSTGLGTLVLIRNEAARATTSFSLVEVPASVARLLELTGLSDAFDIADPSSGRS